MNVTFANFTVAVPLSIAGAVAPPPPQLFALEACARCLSLQGGCTTQTAGLQFVELADAVGTGAGGAAAGTDGSNASSSARSGTRRPALAAWSWLQQVGEGCIRLQKGLTRGRLTLR